VEPRTLALKVLNSLDHGALFPERLLEEAFLQDTRLKERDRAFAVHLVQGVLRWRLRLDWVIKGRVRFPYKRIEPAILNILRIALYQIFYMDRVPESAAVNEAVKQAKLAGQEHVVRFVNGVLREICRKKGRLGFPGTEDGLIQHLSVTHSYPPWLVKKWTRELGTGPTAELLSAGNRIPELVVRANTLKTSRVGLIDALSGEGIRAEPTPYAPEGVSLPDLRGPVNRLKAFRKGLFQVQSEPAQLCSHLLRPGLGERVLDLCAGVGGKSTHMAQLMENKGAILSLDMNHSRLIHLIETGRRLGIDCIQPLVADCSSRLSNLLSSPFDKIFIDGPCSGLGVISRHPDIKWTKNEGDIGSLAVLQEKILNQTPSILKRGGHILYVTCTISRAENEGVIENFLTKYKEMNLEDAREYMPVPGGDLVDEEGFFRSLPHVHGMDGFFGALISKKGG